MESSKLCHSLTLRRDSRGVNMLSSTILTTMVISYLFIGDGICPKSEKLLASTRFFDGSMVQRGPGNVDDRCEALLKKVAFEDDSSMIDVTPSRLQYSWLSQECEMRTGPEYVIRKYTFFENGTFTLLRFHYAEESCSVATHTVMAQGFIELFSRSNLVPGATDAKFQLSTVRVVPLNRQIARKFSHLLNGSLDCAPRTSKDWREYAGQSVYERYPNHDYNHASPPSYSPKSSQQSDGFECLMLLGIEFEELKLLMVEKRIFFFSRNRGRQRVELLLGNPSPSNVDILGAGHGRRRRRRRRRRRGGGYRRDNYGPSSLQSTPLLRADTIAGCPICGNAFRATEYNPPLLHESASLPAILAGSWISARCESTRRGLWSKRRLGIHEGDKLWIGRWEYHADPRCSELLYAINAIGSYEKRPREEPRPAAGIRRSFSPGLGVLLGTIELELHVAESLLIAKDPVTSARCDTVPGTPLDSWRRKCVPHRTIATEAPSTLSLKAKLTVDWAGRYNLFLGPRDEYAPWDAPLRRCGPTSSRNSKLRAYLRRTVALRYGFSLSSGYSATISAFTLWKSFVLVSHLLLSFG